MHGTEEASNDGRVRVCIIHGLNISHKELTYLLQKINKSSKTKHYAHAPRGIDWQEKTIARRRPPLIRKTIKEHLMFQIFTQRLPYVHATGLAIFNTSISEIHNYSTSTTLILSPPYLKTIIKHQTYLSIQRTQMKVSHILNTKYINIKQITMLLTTLKII